MKYIQHRMGSEEHLHQEMGDRIKKLSIQYVHGDLCDSQEKIRKRRLFKKVQAFCEEKVLRCPLGVFWCAESKNQCWQAEKWRLHYLICIFPRWPPN